MNEGAPSPPPAPAPSPSPSRARRAARRAVVGSIVALVLGNALAARHAWAFVTYDADRPPGDRTETPQRLSLGGKLRALLLGIRNPRPRVESDPFAHAPVEDAALVHVPAVLVCGGEDPWVRHDEADSLRGAFAGPASLVIVARSGHAEALGHDPAAWRAAAARLLDLVRAE